ncbi:MAG: GGDEF domain-containing protein [Lautropia sp.]|nr:GGDEF domain-containing protein [Lautropia sp.]
MSSIDHPLPAYRSSPWVQAVGALAERIGLWPAVALMTVASTLLSLLVCMLIASVYPPLSVIRMVQMSLAVPTIIAPPIFFVIFRLIGDLNMTREALRQIANHDGLTQAHTRRFFMEAVNTPPPGATVAPQAPDSILLLDIDDLKQINDRHGHLLGDVVLRAVSDTCRRHLRSRDLFARFGGEEFVILVTEAGGDLVQAIAERIRRAVAELDIRDSAGRQVRVTVSLGIAYSDRRVLGAGAELIQQALGLADQALYAAKRNGKNRTEFARLGDWMLIPV